MRCQYSLRIYNKNSKLKKGTKLMKPNNKTQLVLKLLPNKKVLKTKMNWRGHGTSAKEYISYSVTKSSTQTYHTPFDESDKQLQLLPWAAYPLASGPLLRMYFICRCLQYRSWRVVRLSVPQYGKPKRSPQSSICKMWNKNPTPIRERRARQF